MVSPRKSRDPKTLRPATCLVHGASVRSQFDETSEALFLTQGYLYDTMEIAEARFKGDEPGFIYSRFSNPTVGMFEKRMALLEGAEAARATASGMAAVTASLMGQVKAGDHVVAAKALFGSCLYVVEELLPRFGVESTLVEGTDLDAWRAAMRPNTKTAFLESPTNPTLEVIDIAAVAEIVHQGGATLVVDNVFATPLQQRPLALGADCVVYSATKHIDGQGRALGGIILASDNFVTTHIHNFLRQTGPSLSPFNAWLMLKSLETLTVRVAAQTRSAERIAEFLSQHRRVKRVFYPGRPDHPQYQVARKQMSGGGTLVAFEIDGAKKEAFAFANALSIIGISNNLGDAKSLITHPETTTHQRLKPEQRAALGIVPGLLRLSVGLEDVEDLIEDIDRALGEGSTKTDLLKNSWTHEKVFNALARRERLMASALNRYVTLYDQQPNCAILYSSQSDPAYVKTPLHLRPQAMSWRQAIFDSVKPYVTFIQKQEKDTPFEVYEVDDWNGFAAALALD